MRADCRAPGTAGHAVGATDSVGLLETIRVRQGRTPLLSGHEARLTAACAALAVPPPAQGLVPLVAPWLGGPDRVVRIEVSGGRVDVTTRDVPASTPISIIVAGTPHERYPHKITTRTAFEAAAAEARAARADDALLVTAAGLVAEGTTWNIFWWEPNRLATPPLALGVLPGVGRSRVQTLVPVVERACGLAELRGSSLLATNAVRGVVPIGCLDGAPVPADPRTTELAERFWQT